MKILFISQFYYPENFVTYKIAETLASFGHDVHVITGKPNYGYGYILPQYKKIKDEVINGVKVHRVNIVARKKSRLSIVLNYLSFWINSKRYVGKIKTQFDVVYSFQLSPVTILSAGNLYKKKHHVPHIAHCVDLWPESVLITKAVKEKSLTYKLLYRWSRRLYEKCDRILLGSPSFKEYFSNTLKMDTRNMIFVPQPSLVDGLNCSEVHNYNEGFNILYCGNIGLIQLIEMIPDAMAKIKNPNVKFHIIGMGPKTADVLKRIEELNLNNKVIYHGPLIATKAAPYFAGADALYVSLLDEGVVGKTIPNKLVMSMSFAKPILAMLGGDGAEILKKTGGAVFSSFSSDSLASSIDAISLMSKSELNNMGLSNLEYYKKNFSLTEICRNIEKFLN
ncbi:MAG: glycosyltransferase family 4 protein [Erysipelotrichaceae bacterium]|jgi:glycosyltransferase involved in cell wall biosynthesis|nr:glycosyltransferase family 4 protein [Erysipelotrichaceae bacterium]